MAVVVVLWRRVGRKRALVGLAASGGEEVSAPASAAARVLLVPLPEAAASQLRQAAGSPIELVGVARVWFGSFRCLGEGEKGDEDSGVVPAAVRTGARGLWPLGLGQPRAALSVSVQV